MKKIEKRVAVIALIVTLVMGFLVAVAGFKYVGATPAPKVYICHCEEPDSEEPAQCETLHIAVPAALNHLEQHEADYRGACEVEPTPVPEEEDFCETLEGVQKEDEDCPEPTPTPEVTPEVTPEPQTFSGSSVPQRTCEAIEFTPTITGFERLSPTSVKFTWTATDPINDYVVSFGLTADNLEWNVTVQDTHEVVLNDLPAGVSIWAAIAGSDGVCVGNQSIVVDP